MFSFYNPNYIFVIDQYDIDLKAIKEGQLYKEQEYHQLKVLENIMNMNFFLMIFDKRIEFD